MIFVDTNYFLRFLLDDTDVAHNTAVDLITRASKGTVHLCTSTLVIFEVKWVLSRFYKQDKKQIIKAISSLLDLTFIDIDQRDILHDAVEIFRSGSLSLEDCYYIRLAHHLGCTQIATFDEKLKREF